MIEIFIECVLCTCFIIFFFPLKVGENKRTVVILQKIFMMSASASTTSKKLCSTCNKSAGIFTCDGCQQSFCGKHVGEHRQQLGVELDCLMQEHDLFRSKLDQPLSEENELFKKIDQWEKESITKIQRQAQTARKTLEELLMKSKEQTTKICSDIRNNLQTTREADDFSELDLNRWKEQLKELHESFQSSSSIKLTFEKSSASIRLIKIVTDETNKTTDDKQIPPPPPPQKENTTINNIQERFLQVLGPLIIQEDDYLVKHLGLAADFAYVRGKYLYSMGCFTIRFRIEQCAQPYQIFFGCMASKDPLKELVFKSPSAVGWFGHNQVHLNGSCSTNCKKYNYHSTVIQKDDEIQLTLDCIHEQIRLFHQRKQMLCTLPVDIKLVPFPWQYLVVLYNIGDTLRILPNI